MQNSCSSCVFRDHVLSRKNRNSLHNSQRSTKTQQEEKIEDVMKKIQNIGFGLGFILILRGEFH
jgi:hypothetical protein